MDAPQDGVLSKLFSSVSAAVGAVKKGVEALTASQPAVTPAPMGGRRRTRRRLRSKKTLRRRR